MIGLIVEEEKTQLQELEIQLKGSIKSLDEYQDIEECGKFNDRLKKRSGGFSKRTKSGETEKIPER